MVEWQCSDGKWYGPDRIGYKADFGTAMSAVVVKESNKVRVSRYTSEDLEYPLLKRALESDQSLLLRRG